MRLIDADALEKLIRKEGVLGNGYSDEERERDVIDMVDRIPTIDAKPVRHGRWSERQQMYDGQYIRTCNACGYPRIDENDYVPYCCMCGAKMGAKEDE